MNPGRVSVLLFVLGFAAISCGSTDPAKKPDAPALTGGGTDGGTKSRGDVYAKSDGVQRCALLIGINAYNNPTNAELTGNRWSDLDGTHNDVEILRDALDRFGFDSVAIILDDKATKAGIKAAFDKHLTKCVKGPEDVAFFHYSGHGHQIPDDNGDEGSDGKDEAIVAYDNGGTKDFRGHIRDDAIGAWLDDLQKVTRNVVVSFDSCHSGTATRGRLKARGLGQPGGTTSRGSGSHRAGFFGDDGGEAGVVFLAAARSTESALEAEMSDCEETDKSCVVGRFSFHLGQVLRNASPDMTYGQLMQRVRGSLLALSKDQHPSVFGDANKRLFTGKWAAPGPKTWPIAARKAGSTFETVKIEGVSQLLGIAPGAVFRVYPASGTVDMKAPPLAYVRVSTVGSNSAHARPFSPKGGPPPARSVFYEPRVAVLDPAFKSRGALTVRLSAAAERLKPKLAKMSAMVKLVTSDSGWDIDVRELPAAQCAGGKPCLVLVRQDDTTVGVPQGPEQPMTEQVPLDDKRLVERVKTALEVAFRRKHLHALSNDEAESSARLEVALNRSTMRLDWLEDDEGEIKPFLPEDGDPFGPTEPIIPDQTDGLRICKTGDPECDRYSLEVKNLTNKPLYVAVVSMEVDGSTKLLFPTAEDKRNSLQLLPGGKKKTLLESIVVKPPAGEVYYKVIATTKEVDFGSLEYKVGQDGLARGSTSRGDVSDIEVLLGALPQDATRNDVRVQKRPGRRWGVASYQLTIME